MATWYVDQEAGNDANTGTSFAQRLKTITAVTAAKGLVAGETVRIMGSLAPTSLGINATFTNKSQTITLASALNALIDNCDTAWTQSANVTSTADTAIFRTSTKSAKHVIAAGFTTGLAAFFATGTLNLSAYQGITLWVQVTVKTLSAGELSIRLCSDAAGVTTVDTLALPAITQTGQWIPVYIDKGSALGSSIASIALYGDTDNGAITVYLDNISAVKAAGNDALNLQTLIGKNTAGEYFWALRSINGATLLIDTYPNGSVSELTARGYWGTTETVAAYIRTTIPTALGAATTTLISSAQVAGTAGNLVTYSGGWNRTDMTTQTLQTYFDGQSGFGYAMNTNAKNYVAFDNLYMVRYTRGFVLDNANSDHGSIYAGHCANGVVFTTVTVMTATNIHAWGCYSPGFANTDGNDWTITTMKVISCGVPGVNFGWNVGSSTISGNWKIGTLEINNANWHGLSWSSGSCPSNVTIGTLTVKDNGQSGVAFVGASVGWEITTINANTNSIGVNFNTFTGDIRIGTLNAASNSSSYGVEFGTAGAHHTITIQSLVTSGNNTAGIHIAMLYGNIKIFKSSMAETLKVAADSTGPAQGRLSMHNYNLTADDHRTWVTGGGASNGGVGFIASETTIRKTASGIAWALSPKYTNWITSNWPLTMSLGKFVCAASGLVTVKLWMRRTNTGLTGTLRCRGLQVAGVASDVTSSITAVADTWEEVTITFTPSAIGVIEIDVLCYGGTTYIMYVDDLTITQA